jgi:hypothetical protein
MGEPCQPCRRPNPGFHQPKLGIAPKTYEGELKQTKIRILPKKKVVCQYVFTKFHRSSNSKPRIIPSIIQ